MKIILIYPDDLGKKTEDEIVDWMMALIRNPSMNEIRYTPLKYVSDMEVDW